jgi:hypothetical protein
MVLFDRSQLYNRWDGIPFGDGLYQIKLTQKNLNFAKNYPMWHPVMS